LRQYTLWSVWDHLYTGGMWFSHANTKIFETPPSNKKLKKGIPANMSDYIFLPAMGNYTNGKFNSFRHSFCRFKSRRRKRAKTG